MGILNRLHGQVRELLKSGLRSKQWPALERKFRSTNPKCSGCGSLKHLQVHHVRPFHLFPEFELVESNLIGLCMDVDECHLEIGHGGSFRCYNPNVRIDAHRALHNTASRVTVVRDSMAARLK